MLILRLANLRLADEFMILYPMKVFFQMVKRHKKEAAAHLCSVKKLFWKTLPSLHETICDVVFY